MNIAVAVNGEGFGHATRASCLIRQLQRHHTVVVWAPETIRGFLRRQFPSLRIHDLPLLSQVMRNHRVMIGSTVAHNLGKVLRTPRTVSYLERQLCSERITGVVSDYEPFMSRAAVRMNIPTVVFCHQAVLDTTPDRSWFGALARMLNRFMIPGNVDHVVSSSFFNGDVGPLIRPELRNSPARRGSHILVYGSASIRGPLLKALASFRGEDFRVYPNDGGRFFEDFTSAKAVIGPAGHQMLSEALSLGKPLLTFPQPQQHEQMLNARMARDTGLARIGNIEAARESIAGFLANLEWLQYSPAPAHSGTFCLRDDSERAAKLVQSLLLQPRRVSVPGVQPYADLLK